MAKRPTRIGMTLYICELYETCEEEGCNERKPHPTQSWCRKRSKCVETKKSVKCIVYPGPWKPNVRETGLLEWQCEHGVGHPDSDSADRLNNAAEFLKGIKDAGYGIHGCDGCCSRPDFPSMTIKRRKQIQKATRKAGTVGT